MDVISFWVSVVGTGIGIISLIFTFITLKNTRDIKTNMYKKRILKQSIASLENAVKDIGGRIGYINRDKIIDKIDFVKEFSPIIVLLGGLKFIFSKNQKKQLNSICTTYNNIVTQNKESAIEQLNFLTALKQFCIQIIIYYKENDYE